MSKVKSVLNNISKYYKLTGLYLMKFIHKYYLILIMALATFFALYARYKVVMYPTNDMVGYILNGWLKDIRTNGFASFYKVDSDYSPLYLFMLALISLFPKGSEVTVNGYTFFSNDIIYLKSIYFAYTIALAIGIYLIIKELTKNKVYSSIGYLLVIGLPTVFLNSAIWGNCDVIYSSYLVYAIYFMLKDKQRLVFIFFGLAFANKMQAVFLLPFLVYMVFSRKLKVHKFAYAILTFFVSVLPCYFCGASIFEPFTYIGKQLNGYKKFTLGCANMWQFIDANNSSIKLLSDNATWVGLTLIGITLGIIYFRHIDLEPKANKFKVCILLIMATIFFLPYMHERYFYMIDVLVVVYVILDKKKFYFVPLMQLSSLIAYYHYLTGHYFIDAWGENSVSIAAVINLFIMGVIFYDVLKLDHKENYDEDLVNIDEEIKELSGK